MGLRFRRSVKIMPGVRVNLGKKGASVSVGRRGANMTMGKNGVRTTVGLPGTGLSYTKLHRGNAQNRGNHPSPQRRERKRPIILFAIAFFLIVFLAIFSA